jgi:maleylacetoacetate isomerase
MAKLVLYNYFRSSTSYRARIALYHKNIPFEYKAVHLINNGGEQNSKDYKDKNPMSEVPTLSVDGNTIAQSMAIIEYLEEVYPQNPLLPEDPLTRAQVRQFCEHINSFMHPLGNLKVLQYLEKNVGYDTAKKEEWIRHWTTRGYEALEKILQSTAGRFCFGNQVTAADVFLVPQMFSSQRFHVALDPFPLCQKVNEECLKLLSFQKAHPFNQPDTPPSQ